MSVTVSHEEACAAVQDCLALEGRTSSAAHSDATMIAQPDEPILVTGANGFIGSWVVRVLLARGFSNIRCLARSSSGSGRLDRICAEFGDSRIEVIRGNLLSREVCSRAAEGVSVVYHLAAGVEKSFSGCFLNSVVTTRNLLDAIKDNGKIRRLVNISSLAVYSNARIPRAGVIDETCPIDSLLVERCDPYAYGKAKQDEIVREYGRVHGISYVIVRPGITIGPGKAKIPGRVGINTFGVFMHLGLRNRMPFTYVENCAEAIVLAGLRCGIDGEEFNIVDDSLPSSRTFLRQYKRQVKRLVTIPIPYSVFYLFNFAWEKYSAWSGEQLPPVFNRKMCQAYYKPQTFSNAKAKALLGWYPRVNMIEAMNRFYTYAREREVRA
jgi:nucleoside-diphosphate-sugar epimerase